MARVDDQDYCAWAFAKVQWPDRWDAEYGQRLAIAKAIMKIVRAIMTGQELSDSTVCLSKDEALALFKEE